MNPFTRLRAMIVAAPTPFLVLTLTLGAGFLKHYTPLFAGISHWALGLAAFFLAFILGALLSLYRQKAARRKREQLLRDGHGK